jgi:hypothetical protein
MGLNHSSDLLLKAIDIVSGEEHLIEAQVKHSDLELDSLKGLGVLLNRTLMFHSQQILNQTAIIIYPKLLFHCCHKCRPITQTLLKLVHLHPFSGVIL